MLQSKGIKILLASIFFGILIVISLVVLRSIEHVIPVEADLKKYPELIPFLAGRSGFRGIRFTPDSNEFEVAFPTALKSPDSFFQTVEAQAIAAGWKLSSRSAIRHVYQRRSERSRSTSTIDEIALSYSLPSSEVTLHWQQRNNGS